MYSNLSSLNVIPTLQLCKRHDILLTKTLLSSCDAYMSLYTEAVITNSIAIWLHNSESELYLSK